MTILASAQDPGGAQAIIPILKELIARGNTVRAIVSGPAEKLFAEHDILLEKGSDVLEKGLGEMVSAYAPAVYLAGTSGAYDSIDKQILRVLPKDTRSIYVVDFWNNYALRFSREGKDLAHLPNTICAIDEGMKQGMIEEGIPSERIVVTGNPYFEHFTEGITNDHESFGRLLFISQPVSGLSGFEDYNELLVLERVQEVLSHLPEEYSLVIRKHPQESAEKFTSYLSNRVSVSEIDRVEEDLSLSRTVIGLFSPVLLQAGFAHKNAISYQWGLHKNTFFPLRADNLLAVVDSNIDLLNEIQRDDIRTADLPCFEGATASVLSVIG